MGHWDGVLTIKRAATLLKWCVQYGESLAHGGGPVLKDFT